MPDESFSVSDLGATIAKMLGPKMGETVEIFRNIGNMSLLNALPFKTPQLLIAR